MAGARENRQFEVIFHFIDVVAAMYAQSLNSSDSATTASACGDGDALIMHLMHTVLAMHSQSRRGAVGDRGGGRVPASAGQCVVSTGTQTYEPVSVGESVSDSDSVCVKCADVLFRRLLKEKEIGLRSPASGTQVAMEVTATKSSLPSSVSPLVEEGEEGGEGKRGEESAEASVTVVTSNVTSAEARVAESGVAALVEVEIGGESAEASRTVVTSNVTSANVRVAEIPALAAAPAPSSREEGQEVYSALTSKAVHLLDSWIDSMGGRDPPLDVERLPIVLAENMGEVLARKDSKKTPRRPSIQQSKGVKKRKLEPREKVAARMRLHRARKKGESKVASVSPAQLADTITIPPSSPEISSEPHPLGAHPLVPRPDNGRICAECGNEQYEAGGLWKICTECHQMWANIPCINRTPYVCKFCVRKER